MENAEKCKLTVIYPVMITRDDGFTFKIDANKQFCFDEQGFYEAPYSLITHYGGLAYGYKILTETSFFILFKAMVTFEGYDRVGLEALSLAERARTDKLDKVKDHKAQTLEILGHDIKAFERADYNGRWLQELLEKRDNTNNDIPLD